MVSSCNFQKKYANKNNNKDVNQNTKNDTKIGFAENSYSD